jgi:hypothetical protein
VAMNLAHIDYQNNLLTPGGGSLYLSVSTNTK